MTRQGRLDGGALRVAAIFPVAAIRFEMPGENIIRKPRVMTAVQVASALQAGNADTINARLETRKIGGRRVMGLKSAVAVPILI